MHDHHRDVVAEVPWSGLPTTGIGCRSRRRPRRRARHRHNGQRVGTINLDPHGAAAECDAMRCEGDGGRGRGRRSGTERKPGTRQEGPLLHGTSSRPESLLPEDKGEEEEEGGRESAEGCSGGMDVSESTVSVGVYTSCMYVVGLLHSTSPPQ